MKKIEFCIAALAAFAFGAFAETVVRPAGDGVNTITYEVAPDGTVEIAKMTCVHAPYKIEDTQPEKVTVYRLELHSDANGNEAAFVVGGDGVERPVVLVEPMEYKLLTERLDAVWQSFHATADGRRKLHGKLERTEIDEKARQKVEVYADGYRHTETLPVRREYTKDGKTRLQLKMAEQRKARLLENMEERRPEGMSDKQWEMRKAFLKHRLGVPKQVTVEHDAATGKDTVVEGK